MNPYDGCLPCTFVEGSMSTCIVRSQQEILCLLFGGDQHSGRAGGYVQRLKKNDDRFQHAMSTDAAIGYWIAEAQHGKPSFPIALCIIVP